jgi:hypothetical protein
MIVTSQDADDGASSMAHIIDSVAEGGGKLNVRNGAVFVIGSMFGIGLAGTPASRSLTGSVPVTRAGMASGTADLQRDLGGALFTRSRQSGGM